MVALPPISEALSVVIAAVALADARVAVVGMAARGTVLPILANEVVAHPGITVVRMACDTRRSRPSGIAVNDSAVEAVASSRSSGNGEAVQFDCDHTAGGARLPALT